jgi:hypothetical protein
MGEAGLPDHPWITRRKLDVREYHGSPGATARFLRPAANEALSPRPLPDLRLTPAQILG